MLRENIKCMMEKRCEAGQIKDYGRKERAQERRKKVKRLHRGSKVADSAQGEK